MTPKEKATELANKYYYTHGHISKNTAKDCAIIAVDEIWNTLDGQYRANPNSIALSEREWNKLNEYWQQVKEEIKKL